MHGLLPLERALRLEQSLRGLNNNHTVAVDGKFVTVGTLKQYIAHRKAELTNKSRGTQLYKGPSLPPSGARRFI